MTLNVFSYRMYFIMLIYFEETPASQFHSVAVKIHTLPNNPKLHTLATNEQFNVANPSICMLAHTKSHKNSKFAIMPELYLDIPSFFYQNILVLIDMCHHTQYQPTNPPTDTTFHPQGCGPMNAQVTHKESPKRAETVMGSLQEAPPGKGSCGYQGFQKTYL